VSAPGWPHSQQMSETERNDATRRRHLRPPTRVRARGAAVTSGRVAASPGRPRATARGVRGRRAGPHAWLRSHRWGRRRGAGDVRPREIREVWASAATRAVEAWTPLEDHPAPAAAITPSSARCCDTPRLCAAPRHAKRRQTLCAVTAPHLELPPQCRRWRALSRTVTKLLYEVRLEAVAHSAVRNVRRRARPGGQPSRLPLGRTAPFLLASASTR
jgi:hypothetical protein